MFGKSNDKNPTRAERRESWAKEYEKGGWRNTAHKDSPAGRNRDAGKKSGGWGGGNGGSKDKGWF